MSSDIEAFVSAPSVSALALLKKTELIQVAECYKLTMSSGMKKGEIRQLILSYLHDEELVSEDEGDFTDSSAASLKRLELQERAKEREVEVKQKELQLREKELEI